MYLKAAFCLFLSAAALFGAKKVTSTDTSASNDQVDLDASLVLTEEQATQVLGADPGAGIVLLRVKLTPRTDTPLQVSPDDFILLAHDDGERNKPFTPAEIAGQGALVANAKKGSTAKKSGMVSVMGLGAGSSPGNAAPVTVNTKMDDKAAGNEKLLAALKAKQLPIAETSKPLEGYLYFALDGKHSLKNLAVLYRGPAGKLNLEFVH